MSVFHFNFIESALKLPRLLKQSAVLIVDINMCLLTIWLSFFLRTGELPHLNQALTTASIISVSIAIPIFYSLGLYRSIFRYSGSRAVRMIGYSIMIYGSIYAAMILIVEINQLPRTIGLIQPLLLFFGMSGSRLLANSCLRKKHHETRQLINIAIYGAGFRGQQAADLVNRLNGIKVVGFVDDDPALQGLRLNGHFIYSIDSVPMLVQRRNLTRVLLAFDTRSSKRNREILDILAAQRLTVSRLPSFSDLAIGNIPISGITNLEIDDLLNRESVEPNHNLLKKKICKKTILVTGAGGSIGSELCRQIIKLNPKTLVIVEINEFSLYSLHNELSDLITQIHSEKKPELVPLLSSVINRKRMKSIMSTWLPDVIYHVAAYKHVSLVEQNTAEGIMNNVFGTLIVAQEAISLNIDDFILISSDKAVRPTNIMGATKRLAEMILQAHQKEGCKTKFTIVRFGNVMDSSGSVIPRFKTQISSGGPVTVTHPDVTRYFMTIPEASQLVIQASALAKGGEVFVLDMGDPVKIIDIAKRMIELSGLSEKTNSNPNGKIEIQITGLRPGEKLHEELTLRPSKELSIHPQIFKVDEPSIPWASLCAALEKLELYVNAGDIEQLIHILEQVVEGFSRSDQVSDLAYQPSWGKSN